MKELRHDVGADIKAVKFAARLRSQTQRIDAPVRRRAPAAPTPPSLAPPRPGPRPPPVAMALATAVLQRS